MCPTDPRERKPTEAASFATGRAGNVKPRSMQLAMSVAIDIADGDTPINSTPTSGIEPRARAEGIATTTTTSERPIQVDAVGMAKLERILFMKLEDIR